MRGFDESAGRYTGGCKAFCWELGICIVTYHEGTPLAHNNYLRFLRCALWFRAWRRSRFLSQNLPGLDS